MSNDIIFAFCQTCSIKDCIKYKSIEGCWECDKFPCRIIEEWPSLEGKKVMLNEIIRIREIGIEKWIQNVEEKHKCSQCGAQLYRGAQSCYICQKLI